MKTKKIIIASAAAMLTTMSACDMIPHKPTPEEIEQMRQDSIRDARIAEAKGQLQACQTPLAKPKGDTTYLDPFFAQLDSAKKQPVRIMYYGDSQLEGDRMTCVLREQLQKRFGGKGPGMLPARLPGGTYTCTLMASPQLPEYRNFGGGAVRTPDNGYGPRCEMWRAEGSATLTYVCQKNDKYGHAATFRKVTVVAKGTGTITANGTALQAETKNEGLNFYTATLAEDATQATIAIQGSMDIYGVMLDGTSGVSVDNVAQRGSSGISFTQVAEPTIRPYYDHANVGLIILQFGVNAIPTMTSDKQVESFVGQLQPQVAFFKQMVPQAKVLFIGPADMGRRTSPTLSHPMVGAVSKALKQMCLKEGVAYWDMFAAMGGEGAMSRWAQEKPSLASPDLIHFSHQGAEKIATMFTESLMLYYDYYDARK